jgi:hypothetical protein
MGDGVSMIFFRSGGYDLDAAARSLAGCGLSVSRLGKHLAVRRADGPELRVGLATGAGVREEAAEVGAGTAHAAPLAGCDARFEIAFDSLDEVLDEINTLIEVQATLQDDTQGFLFNTWNGQLSGPGE